MSAPDALYLILSREGVLDDPARPLPERLEEWQLLPGSLEAMARLCRQGWRLLLSSDAGDGGDAVPQALYAMCLELRQRLRQLVPSGGVDAVLFCGCKDGREDCPCAQPEIQLFPEIARRLGRPDLNGIPSVADLGVTAVAARAAGADPIHVLSGRGTAELKRGAVPSGVPVYPDLDAYVERLAES